MNSPMIALVVIVGFALLVTVGFVVTLGVLKLGAWLDRVGTEQDRKRREAKQAEGMRGAVTATPVHHPLPVGYTYSRCPQCAMSFVDPSDTPRWSTQYYSHMKYEHRGPTAEDDPFLDEDPTLDEWGLPL